MMVNPMGWQKCCQKMYKMSPFAIGIQWLVYNFIIILHAYYHFNIYHVTPNFTA